MARQHHYRRRAGEPAELDMTTFLNLMVVLVPFLLITAVFSRITIVELTLPSASDGTPRADKGFRDLQSLLACIRLADVEIFDIYTDLVCIGRIQRVLDVDKGADPTGAGQVSG